MAMFNYQNFDIQIRRSENAGSYAVSVVGPAGDYESEFLREDLNILTTGTPDSGSGIGRGFIVEDGMENNFDQMVSRPPTLEQARIIGQTLFEAVFKEEILSALLLSIKQVGMEGGRLRIRLKLTSVPELARLPWEYLYNEKKGHFYAQGSNTSLVRYLGIKDPIEELLVNPPLRILAIISNPKNTTSLNVEKEWENLQKAVKGPEGDNDLVEIVPLKNVTLSSLNNKLADQPLEKPFHVLHFIGHGVFDRKTGKGQLLFENEDGSLKKLSGGDLAPILQNYRALRLIVLNACEGASISAVDSYAGVAQSLLHQANVPAVIAMQYEISDPAAIIFSERFYQKLAEGQPVDSAMTLARMAVYSKNMEQSTDIQEFAVPVIYMRSDSGDIVKRVQTPETARPPVVVNRQPVTDLDVHLEKVIDAILKGELVPFIGLDVNLYDRGEDDNWQPGTSLPSSRELAKYLARQFNYPLEEVPELMSASQYAVTEDDGMDGQLYTCVSNVFRHDIQPTVLHKVIAKIPQLLKNKNAIRVNDPVRQRFIITTTNYDNLLERAFVENDSKYNVVTYITDGEQSGSFHHVKYSGADVIKPLAAIDSTYDAFEKENDPIILKLPGMVEAVGHRFAITEDHYSDYLTYKNLSGLLPAQLNSKLKNSHHLFLGASLRNWHLRALLYRIWEKRRPSFSSWAVHPNAQEIDKKFWAASRINVIDENFETYIKRLQDRLENALK